MGALELGRNISSISLDFVVKNAILEEIRKIDMDNLSNYATTNKDRLNYEYSNKKLDDRSIEQALETAVIRRAKSDFRYLIMKSPQTLKKPECLAYAIQKKSFTLNEISSIRFGPGDVKGFLETYGSPDYITTLKYELIGKKSEPEITTAVQEIDRQLTPTL